MTSYRSCDAGSVLYGDEIGDLNDARRGGCAPLRPLALRVVRDFTAEHGASAADLHFHLIVRYAGMSIQRIEDSREGRLVDRSVAIGIAQMAVLACNIGGHAFLLMDLGDDNVSAEFQPAR